MRVRHVFRDTVCLFYLISGRSRADGFAAQQYSRRRDTTGSRLGGNFFSHNNTAFRLQSYVRH